MTTSATARRLTSALRARFPGGPKDFLRRIGLDENLLDVGALGGGGSSSSAKNDAARELRVRIEQILPELYLEENQLGPLMRILDEHCPLGSASDDEEKIGEYLRGRGLGEPDVKTALDMVRRRAIGRDESEEERGRLTERERSQIGRPGSEARAEEPESVFLGPHRTYPVKTKKNGRWEFDRDLLLAAARRARLEHEPEIARRADSIRAQLGEGAATDTLPRPATKGGFGGKFSEKRAASPMSAEQTRAFRELLEARNLDSDEIEQILSATSGTLSGSMAGDAAIGEIRRAMARIKVEPGYGPERRTTAATTTRQRQSFADRYGGDAMRLVQ